jgi:hypothetical protein
MGKKCIPGVFCIENMTLFVLFIIVILLWYIYYTQINRNNGVNTKNPNIIVVAPPTNASTISPLATISTRNDPFNDPYSPPMKADGIYFPRETAVILIINLIVKII